MVPTTFHGHSAAGAEVSHGASRAASRFIEAGGRGGHLGVVLGTGLGGLSERLEHRFVLSAVDTGWLPCSTASGHAGLVVSGHVAGSDIVVLQGRVHAYEGHPADILVRGVELLSALGVRRLLLTNAAGGLDPGMRVGDIVTLRDHIDFVRRCRLPSALVEPRAGRLGVVTTSAFVRDVYAPALVDRSVEAARSGGHRCGSGVYAYVSGPSYETRAEYRLFRQVGADVVGMSTVPEAIRGWQLGLEVVAVSIVTNVARPDASVATKADEVCQAATSASEGIWLILESLLTP